MSKQDSEILNSKINISTLCKSFGYDAMSYRVWVQNHGLILGEDNSISIADFNAFIRTYLTKSDDLDYLKAEKMRKEIELAQIKIDTERGEFYRTDVVHEIINTLMVTVRDRVLQIKQDTQQVYTAGTQIDADAAMADIARTVLIDIHGRLDELTQRIKTDPVHTAQLEQSDQSEQNSADNKNNNAEAIDESAKPRRGRPRKTS